MSSREPNTLGCERVLSREECESVPPFAQRCGKKVTVVAIYKPPDSKLSRRTELCEHCADVLQVKGVLTRREPIEAKKP